MGQGVEGTVVMALGWQGKTGGFCLFWGGFLILIGCIVPIVLRLEYFVLMGNPPFRINRVGIWE